MNTICVTCLSSERRLIQLQNLLAYTNIWHGVFLQMTDYICWECKAMFNNIWRFKQQVLTAQDVLRNQNMTELPKVKQCLSKLTKSIKISYDSEYYEDDVIKTEPPEPPSVVYLDETIVKKKENFTEDCSLTEPMKTEIEDAEFNSEDKVEIEIYSHSRERVTNESEQCNVSIPKTELEHNVYQPSTTEKDFIIKKMSEDEFLKARESDRALPRYKNRPYKCEKCIVAYSKEEQYKNHCVKHTAERGDFLCKICNVHFFNDNSCKIHTMKHYICYQCKVCEFTSHRIQEMTAHDRKEHKMSKTYLCHICNNEFIDLRRLTYHRTKEHSGRTVCAVCGKHYSSPEALNNHMLKHKGIRKPSVECEICKKRFVCIKQHMLTHSKVVANENAYCAECNIQYKSVGTYRIHLRSSKHVAPDKFPYICAECGRKFVQKNNLICHLNGFHYNKKQFFCRICNKGFLKSDGLKYHMLYTHEGVSKPRKYICNKGFTASQVLANHIRTHTGEKPFECHLCGTKFSQKTALRTHIKGVHKKLYRKGED